MNTQKAPLNALEDVPVNLKVKLAALWTSLMFVIIYLDYFHLYMPGMIDKILQGEVFVFDITQGFLSVALTIVTIPSLMIFLSVALAAKVNRLTNITVAAVNIPLILFNLAGEAWMHMMLGAIVQVIILCLIIQYSWKWPRTET
jgi:hypothetical protein